MGKTFDTVNRVSIFQTLTLGQLDNLDIPKFESLLGDHYPAFITLCDCIKQRDDIKSISCDVNIDSIMFKAILVNGEIETI